MATKRYLPRGASSSLTASWQGQGRKLALRWVPILKTQNKTLLVLRRRACKCSEQPGCPLNSTPAAIANPARIEARTPSIVPG